MFFKRKLRQHYYSSVSYTDSRVGLVLEELDKSGFADDTIIVFLGDHGKTIVFPMRFFLVLKMIILSKYIKSFIELIDVARIFNYKEAALEVKSNWYVLLKY